MTKFGGFLCDAYYAEWTYGKLQVVKKAIAAALARLVETGLLRGRRDPPAPPPDPPRHPPRPLRPFPSLNPGSTLSPRKLDPGVSPRLHGITRGGEAGLPDVFRAGPRTVDYP